MTAPALIELCGVSKRYGSRVVLDDVSFALPRNATTVLVGPSGAGKSTVLRLLVGLARPDSGRILVDGADVSKLNRDGWMALRKRVGMLFQEGALFNSMSVLDNVAFPLRHHTRLPRDEREQVALSKLAAVGIGEELARRTPDTLSGGQRKRVGLARALALDPEIVLFDEPTAGLDPVTSAAIDALIVDVGARLKTTFLVITHDIHSCAAIAQHVGLLLEGRLLVFGHRDRVLQSGDPTVRQFFDRRAEGPIRIA
ncbi:MAG: ATP-binding cassette domain-containing protein [Deltaproteobacteria bacterium]|nr:ATP-binding cassette domain-containing protein [Deltaproteobacteria bacterium]